MKVYTLFIIVFLFLAISTKAQNTSSKDVFVIKEDSIEKQSLKGYVSLLYDSLVNLSIAEVSSPTYDTCFKTANEWDRDLVLDSKSVFWIKVTIQNATKENHWRIGSNARHNNIVYYSPDGIHYYTGISGMSYKPSDRNLPYHPISNYSVPIFLTERKQDIYIKISSLTNKIGASTKIQIRNFLNKFYVIPEKQIETGYVANTNFDVAFFGICICMMLYNLSIFLFVKDKSYLYYSISILGVVGYFFFLDGYYFATLFDIGLPRWEYNFNNLISAFSADISIFFFLLFSQVFLFANQKNTRWYKILGYLKWYLLIANVVFKCYMLWADRLVLEESDIFHNVNYGFVIVVLIALCVNLWRNKKPVYSYYIYANLPFFILIIAYIAYVQSFVDIDRSIFLLNNSFQIGIMLQIISFSIALAARINFMRHEIEQKKLDNEQLNHRLLRTQMDPHFIFNSLAAIQNYLFENEPHKTATYLAKFSKLMRQVLENSRQDFVSLEKEIQTLENYLQLQQMRFGEKLSYSIEISPLIDPELIEIPPMFAQPFIENSIEHGLLYKEGRGMVNIAFSLDADVVVLEVKDNGVGLEQAKIFRSEVKNEHKSLATQITQERLTLLRQKYGLPLDFMLSELKTQLDEVVGTLVRVELPYQG